MKKIMLSVFAFVVIATVSSCKCSTCIKDNAPDVKICKDDYNTTNDYNDAVRFAKDFGYKCHGSN